MIDSIPVPVCRRVRAWRCRKVRGGRYGGYCAALHDLTPLHELADALPKEARLFGDKAYISAPDTSAILAECGVHVIAQPRINMTPLAWADAFDLHLYRHTIETVNSQLEKMGIEHLYARTNPGFMLKVCASMIALACSNLN